ncbi:MAG TPA: hypothetical protein VEU50_35095, partial [Archangium sp.]|nr:hypothetical protein [Archangium sp.]
MERNDVPEPISAFLEREGAAGPGDCEALVEQAMALLEEAYVHLPVARASGADPIGQLGALRRQRPETRLRLYQELLSVFARLGDRHTRCSLPEPFASSVAFLPFMVGEFFEHGERRLAVLRSGTNALERGDLIVSWNGVPVMDVIHRHMAWQHGANQEARRAKAVQTLTFRPLALMPPPGEEVTLECDSAAGSRQTVRLGWRVAGASWLAQHFASLPEDGLCARTVETSHGTFGYMRVSSLHGSPETFLDGFVQALESMPREGLILDMRSCEEGFVQLGERLLQLFTPRRIQPERFQFRVTELILRLVRSCAALSD